METGTYLQKPPNFKEFETYRFVPFLFDPKLYPLPPCGAATLALLTGGTPLYFSKKYKKYKGHFPDKVMVKELNLHGFKTFELTKSNLTNSLTPQNNIKDYHVLLVSQLCMRGEATWSVIYKDLTYHNFEVARLDTLEFINRPISTVYLIWHSLYKPSFVANKYI